MTLNNPSMQLDPDECRVLGVLIEKAHTTPDQYPLTLNGLAAGCSQKSNRNPVETYDEARVYEAVDRLRSKQLIVEAFMTGSRVAKFRHEAREALGVDTPQLAVLAELLLRGPQTQGELRGRASRIRLFESVEEVAAVLERLAEHEPSFVRQIAPAPGSRAPRFTQQLCPDLHPLESQSDAVPSAPRAGANTEAQRIASLETEIALLRHALVALATSLGCEQVVEELADHDRPDAP